MFNMDLENKPNKPNKKNWLKEAMEHLKRIKDGAETVPTTFSDSLVEFSDEFLKESGGVQKFVLIQKGDSLIFVSKPTGHVELLELAQKEFGDDFINRGGGFLSSDPYDRELKILNRFSNRIGPIHVPRSVVIKFLSKKFKDYYDHVVGEN